MTAQAATAHPRADLETNFGRAAGRRWPCRASASTAGARLVVALLLCCGLASAQGAAPAAARALRQLTAGQPVRSVVLQGNADWVAGADQETGTATLSASGAGSSRVELALTNGTQVEVRSGPIQAPRGARRAVGLPRSDGAAQRMPLANGFTPAAWFFPALILQRALQPHYRSQDLGTERVNGTAVEHLRLSWLPTRGSAAMRQEISALSQADLYLDASSGLPLLLRYQQHPGGNVRAQVRVEIRYGDWGRDQGMLVPHQIERWISGVRNLTVTVTSVQLNPSLPAGRFQLQEAQ